MAILDKYRRKKEKEKEFLELGDINEEKGAYGPAGEEKPETASPPTDLPAAQTESFIQKDIQIANAKISALASEIEALKQRVKALEERAGTRPAETLAPAHKETEWHY